MTFPSPPRLRHLLAASLFPLLLWTASAGAQQAPAGTQPVESIAAVVNEGVILRSELDRAIANVRAQYADRPNMLPPPAVLERQVLERLIIQRLELESATRAGITATDADIDRAVESVRQQNGMTLDQLRERLAKDGMTLTDFRNNLRDEIISQKLQHSYAQGRINVSEAEVDAALANASAEATHQFHLAHILIALPDGANAEQIATATAKIEDIKGKIERGELSFAAAAVRYSQSTNALEGGDLGWRSANEIPPAFASTILQMQPGQLIGPIRGPSGFQLVQLIESRDQAPATEGATTTQYSAREILVKVDADTDDAAAKAKIDAVAAQLAGGADFAKLAREHSEDQATRLRGGDLGWFTADAQGAAFALQLASLADGQTSAPFKTDQGWVILQRTATREISAGDEARRAQIRETIGRRKLDEEWTRFLRETRSEAYVDIRGQAATVDLTAPASGG